MLSIYLFAVLATGNDIIVCCRLLKLLYCTYVCCNRPVYSQYMTPTNVMNCVLISALPKRVPASVTRRTANVRKDRTEVLLSAEKNFKSNELGIRTCRYCTYRVCVFAARQVNVNNNIIIIMIAKETPTHVMHRSHR